MTNLCFQHMVPLRKINLHIIGNRTNEYRASNRRFEKGATPYESESICPGQDDLVAGIELLLSDREHAAANVQSMSKVKKSPTGADKKKRLIRTP